MELLELMIIGVRFFQSRSHIFVFINLNVIEFAHNRSKIGWKSFSNRPKFVLSAIKNRSTLSLESFYIVP